MKINVCGTSNLFISSFTNSLTMQKNKKTGKSSHMNAIIKSIEINIAFAVLPICMLKAEDFIM